MIERPKLTHNKTQIQIWTPTRHRHTDINNNFKKSHNSM